ncbi:MAG: hypothetical protein H6721_21285 [Sandaracinus sp.]|nr:hypothetical protein [Sandaracinus sp.]
MALYVSPRATMQVEALDLGRLRARIDTGVADDAPTLRRLVELENESESYGGPCIPLFVERLEGGHLEVVCDTLHRPRLPADRRLRWRECRELVVGLCLLASRLHAEGHALGPPTRALVFGTEFLWSPFAALHGFVHRVESNLRGGQLPLFHFKLSPEMRVGTPTSDVFFLTQFLFELVTAREAYRFREDDYVRYVEELRRGPTLVDAVWRGVGVACNAPMPESALVFRKGLHPDPDARYPDPQALLEALER